MYTGRAFDGEVAMAHGQSESVRHPPVLILVNGAPAAGKSTLAQAMAEATNLDVFSKDRVKEELYDIGPFPLDSQAGFERSQALGARAVEIMFERVRAHLDAGKSAIVDCNMVPEHVDGILARWTEEAPLSRDPDSRQRQRVDAASEVFGARGGAPSRAPGHVAGISRNRAEYVARTGSRSDASRRHHL